MDPCLSLLHGKVSEINLPQFFLAHNINQALSSHLLSRTTSIQVHPSELPQFGLKYSVAWYEARVTPYTMLYLGVIKLEHIITGITQGYDCYDFFNFFI